MFRFHTSALVCMVDNSVLRRLFTLAFVYNRNKTSESVPGRWFSHSISQNKLHCSWYPNHLNVKEHSKGATKTQKRW